MLMTCDASRSFRLGVRRRHAKTVADRGVDARRLARSARRSSNDDRPARRSQTVYRIGSMPSAGLCGVGLAGHVSASKQFDEDSA